MARGPSSSGGVGPAPPRHRATARRDVGPRVTKAGSAARWRGWTQRRSPLAIAPPADVVSQPVGDGMARLTIDLPVWTSVACRNAIEQLAASSGPAATSGPSG
jgi:hypothetical protein